MDLKSVQHLDIFVAAILGAPVGVMDERFATLSLPFGLNQCLHRALAVQAGVQLVARYFAGIGIGYNA